MISIVSSSPKTGETSNGNRGDQGTLQDGTARKTAARNGAAGLHWCDRSNSNALLPRRSMAVNPDRHKIRGSAR